MALLFYSPDEDAQAWRRALLRRLPDLDYRVWPDVGDPAEIDAALVWRAPPGLLRTLPNLKAGAVAGGGRRRACWPTRPCRTCRCAGWSTRR